MLRDMMSRLEYVKMQQSRFIMADDSHNISQHYNRALSTVVISSMQFSLPECASFPLFGNIKATNTTHIAHITFGTFRSAPKLRCSLHHYQNTENTRPLLPPTARPCVCLHCVSSSTSGQAHTQTFIIQIRLDTTYSCNQHYNIQLSESAEKFVKNTEQADKENITVQSLWSFFFFAAHGCFGAECENWEGIRRM